MFLFPCECTMADAHYVCNSLTDSNRESDEFTFTMWHWSAVVKDKREQSLKIWSLVKQIHLPLLGQGLGWSHTGCTPWSGTACRCWCSACHPQCPSSRWFCRRGTVCCWAWVLFEAQSKGRWGHCLGLGTQKGTSQFCYYRRPPADSSWPHGPGLALHEAQHAVGCHGKPTCHLSHDRSGRLL